MVPGKQAGSILSWDRAELWRRCTEGCLGETESCRCSSTDATARLRGVWLMGRRVPLAVGGQERQQQEEVAAIPDGTYSLVAPATVGL